MKLLSTLPFLALLVACSADEDKDETIDGGASVSIDAWLEAPDADTRVVAPEACSVVCPHLVACEEFASAEACQADCAVVLGDCSSEESDTITACVEVGDPSDCSALARCIDAVACSEE